MTTPSVQTLLRIRAAIDQEIDRNQADADVDVPAWLRSELARRINEALCENPTAQHVAARAARAERIEKAARPVVHVVRHPLETALPALDVEGELPELRALEAAIYTTPAEEVSRD